MKRPTALVALIGLAFATAAAPLPSACDPRAEEVAAEKQRDLLKFSGLRTRAELEAALAWVDPGGHLKPYYQLHDDAFVVRRDVDEAHARRPWGGSAADDVVTIRLRAATGAAAPIAAATAPAPRPLRKIALDPGHFGGAWSQREDRHVVRDGGQPVREGDLSWATTRLIAEDLQRAGRDVVVLRGPPPTAPFPTGQDDAFDPTREAAFRLAEQSPATRPWLTPLFAGQLWLARWRMMANTPFELYQRYDLRRRAAAAAAATPDLTLSIHYNTTDNEQNGVIAFLPGNFVAEDFATPAQRHWAFVRVLDGTLGESQRLGRAFGLALQRHLDLPAYRSNDDHRTGRYWRLVDGASGLYARNLAILRRTPGVVLLLEGPCVNERAEYQRLQTGDVDVDGQRFPARVRQYADAVLDVLRDEP